jgi:hypothetical protein
MMCLLAACSGAPAPARSRTEAEVRAAIEPPGWDALPARARPLVPPGPPSAAADLAAAHAIARRHERAWGDRRRELKAAASASAPAASLAEFPEADAAIAGLMRWAAQRGSVPAIDPSDPDTMPGFNLAMVAIVTSDATRRDALLAAASYGARLLTEGGTLIEGMLGLAILRAAMERATAIGQPLPPEMALPDDVITRMLAAEAAWGGDMLAEQLSGAGSARAFGAAPSTEREVVTMLASMRVRNEWWLAALACAPRGSDRATIARCFTVAPPASSTPVSAAVADPRADIQPYVSKLATLLDDLHAHVATAAPAPP